GDTEVGRILGEFRPGFRDEVANMLSADTPEDIYGSIVSSQFDGDRLDYIQRDRLMSGVHHGGFDCSWLMANLEVDRVPLARDEETIGSVDALILGRKALQAAEDYVLGIFHLYFTIYFHKTTRGAERMLSALLLRVGALVQDNQLMYSGLETDHPIICFLREGTLKHYLKLDDFVFWSAFQSMASAKDEIVRELSQRLVGRKLYKAIDVTAQLGSEAAVARFRARLTDARNAGEFGLIDLLEDSVSRDPYQRRGFETP